VLERDGGIKKIEVAVTLCVIPDSSAVEPMDGSGEHD
jgi:hypothetical protein